MKKYKVLWIFLTCAALALASLLVQNNYLIILADQIIISIIVLMGLNFVTGMMGQMNLGTAGIMALGAYTSALLCTKLSMSSWLSLLFVILMGIAIGIIISEPSHQGHLSGADDARLFRDRPHPRDEPDGSDRRSQRRARDPGLHVLRSAN